MSKAKKVMEHWHKWLKDNFLIMRRAGPSIGIQRSYKHVALTKEFESMDAERKRRRLNVLENQKESRKKLLENQVRLLETAEKFRKDIENSTKLDEESKTRALHFFDNLDPNQKNQMLKLKEVKDISQIDSFKDYRQIYRMQEDGLSEITDKSIIKHMTKSELDQTLTDLESQLTEISAELGTMESLKVEADDLESTHVVLEGTQKLCISNMVQLFELRAKMGHGLTVHPESMEILEKLQYALDHNLPVRREHLYALAPEIFTYEIGELKRIQGERFTPKTIELLDQDPGDGVYLRHYKKSGTKMNAIREANKPELTKLTEKHYEEEHALYEFMERTMYEWLELHDDYFAAKFEEGWQGFDDILTLVENKPAELRTPVETQIMKGVIIVRNIHRDYEDLVEQNENIRANSFWKLELPEYITRNPILMEHFHKVHQYTLRHSRPFDKSWLQPYSAEEMGEFEQPKVEEVIESHRKTEVQRLIDESDAEFKHQTIAGDVIKHDLEGMHEKDPRLIEKVNVLTDVLHIIEDKVADRVSMQKQKLPNRYQHDMLDFRPEESKIQLREFTKMLALNNRDPQKYNIKYWAAYFNIRPQKLKNIFNFVSYPIVEGEDVVKILRFINFDE